jgi:hypothetical protein
MIYRSPVAREVFFDNTAQSLLASTAQDAIIENRQLVGWDPEFITTSASGTSTLINTSKTLQIVTGSASGHSVVLPNATTLYNGRKFEIVNKSSQPISIKDGSSTLLFNLNPDSVGGLTLQSNSSTAGLWISVIVSTIASGIQSYNIISSTTFTTTSTTDVLITGFQITPLSGTYAIWYSASCLVTKTPYTHWWSIYRAGTKIADSERSQDTAHSNQTMSDMTQSIVSLNGSQTCDIRVRVQSTGSLSVYQRSLLFIRLGV